MTDEGFPASNFDAWAPTYDQDTAANTSFPFAGYRQALERVLQRAQVRPGHKVLDLGAGTGNLTALFAAAGCRVWGTDYSSEMLAAARKKLPQFPFIRADMRDPWPAGLPARFDRIISGYAFHHFETGEKLRLICDLALNHLSGDGKIVIADVGFGTLAEREAARRQLGDAWDEEYYWVAETDIPALQAAGLLASFEAVSPCAGVVEICHNRLQ